MKYKDTKATISLRHVKKIMSYKEQYKHGKFNSTSLMALSFISFILALFIGIFIKVHIARTIWFIVAGLQLAVFTKHFLIKGFIELIDEEYEIKSNHCHPIEGDNRW